MISKRIENIIKLYMWLFSKYPEKKNALEPKDKLLYNMRVTAKSRYNASKRIDWQMKVSFFTITILSLGLIFIPLVQNAGVKLHFTTSLLNMMQIFLAVSVLVYSVMNGMAKYESRIQSLRECGDGIRDLIREFRSDEFTDNETLGKYSKLYNSIVTKPENHADIDYLFARLELKEDFKITGLRRIWYYLRYIVVYIIPFSIPILLLALEFTFISDILGVTEIFVGIFEPENLETLKKL